jgi:hypothetical protein
MDAPSEKRAAVVKRGTEREKRDLFATRPPDLGSVKQTLLPPPNGVASRNESSVLFTVAAVRPSEKVIPMSKDPMENFVPEDDGIIDLMALKSIPPPPRAPADPLFAAPLSEPPGGFAREVASSSSSVSMQLSKLGPHKTIVMIAAAAVLFLVVGTIGVSAVFSDTADAKRAAQWTHIPSPKLASAPPPVTAASSEPEDNASTTEKHGKKGKARRGGFSAASGKAVITSKTPYVAPAPPPKAADTCGCHGDFNCILRCSAKGK